MLKDSAPKPEHGGVSRARVQRQKPTLPEALLWRALKDRPYGLKFRRQHPSGRYVIDFYCIDARLAVEVDGEAHNRGDRPQRDAERDTWLARADIATLRIPAGDLLHRTDAVIEGVVEVARSRLPLHHPAAPDRDR